VSLEAAGIPTVFVASSEFERAADVQADALGMPAVRRIFVPHPIQDRTDAEMADLAMTVVDQVVAALTAG
jgi:hypothetical protein